MPARVLRHLYTAILRFQLLDARRSLESPEAAPLSLRPANAGRQGWRISEIVAATCARNHDQILGAGMAARLARGESFADIVRMPANSTRELALPVHAAEHWTVDQLAAILSFTAKLQAKDRVLFALLGKDYHADSFRRVLQACGPARLSVVFYVETQFRVGAGRGANQRRQALRFVDAEFGVPVITTDVHDPVGLYRVTTEAMHNARFERGPTVIETAHVIASGRKARIASPDDPLSFLQSYMEARQIWDGAWASQQHTQALAELGSAVAHS